MRALPRVRELAVLLVDRLLACLTLSTRAVPSPASKIKQAHLIRGVLAHAGPLVGALPRVRERGRLADRPAIGLAWLQPAVCWQAQAGCLQQAMLVKGAVKGTASVSWQQRAARQVAQRAELSGQLDSLLARCCQQHVH